MSAPLGTFLSIKPNTADQSISLTVTTFPLSETEQESEEDGRGCETAAIATGFLPLGFHREQMCGRASSWMESDKKREVTDTLQQASQSQSTLGWVWAGPPKVNF